MLPCMFYHGICMTFLIAQGTANSAALSIILQPFSDLKVFTFNLVLNPFNTFDHLNLTITSTGNRER